VLSGMLPPLISDSDGCASVPGGMPLPKLRARCWLLALVVLLGGASGGLDPAELLALGSCCRGWGGPGWELDSGGVVVVVWGGLGGVGGGGWWGGGGGGLWGGAWAVGAWDLCGREGVEREMLNSKRCLWAFMICPDLSIGANLLCCGILCFRVHERV
jgi:hypothetical protein